jgi:AcrR family transcriptional regulator
VEQSQTSKGTFYHYFHSKDDLLSSLSVLFDKKYEELIETMDPGLDPIEKLLLMNQELFLMIENTVTVSLLSQLFGSQLTTKGERHLLNPDRTYYKLLRQIAIEGKEKGLFRDDLSVNDITKAYAIFERAVMYDWCISDGNYSICQYSGKMLPLFLDGLCRKM